MVIWAVYDDSGGQAASARLRHSATMNQTVAAAVNPLNTMKAGPKTAGRRHDSEQGRANQGADKRLRDAGRGGLGNLALWQQHRHEQLCRHDNRRTATDGRDTGSATTTSRRPSRSR